MLYFAIPVAQTHQIESVLSELGSLVTSKLVAAPNTLSYDDQLAHILLSAFVGNGWLSVSCDVRELSDEVDIAVRRAWQVIDEIAALGTTTNGIEESYGSLIDDQPILLFANQDGIIGQFDEKLPRV